MSKFRAGGLAAVPPGGGGKAASRYIGAPVQYKSFSLAGRFVFTIEAGSGADALLASTR
jgi:hypothetical protein